jgi:hypothetical protein
MKGDFCWKFTDDKWIGSVEDWSDFVDQKTIKYPKCPWCGKKVFNKKKLDEILFNWETDNLLHGKCHSCMKELYLT